ncbi:MAG TPA: RNA polymerase factor sigma-54, partial [Paracoccaceae bacterium]|nr:RNA polymerase factor sigma-54 [Paracoccaceae bacterium]
LAYKMSTALIGEIYERGYIFAPLFEIALRLSVPVTDVEDGLRLLQSCEPTGIGARSLAECLSLQLAENGHLNSDMAAVLENLNVLQKGGCAQLSKETGLPEERVQTLLGQIRRTNPFPANAFFFDGVDYAIPDVLVNPAPQGGWTVELNADSTPRARINVGFFAEVSASGTEAKLFINSYRDRANFILRAMDQRAKTVLRVATEIVKLQHEFFEEGVLALRPMTLARIAESLSIHESTVSRVTNGKYMQTPRGNFELKYFFSSGIDMANGSQISAKAVQHKLQRLISLEDSKKPLSDGAIAKMLQVDGVDIARRTIAKYREAMGIPSSSLRRRN